MTNEIESPEPRGLALRGLPWLLAAGALLLYFFTLNHWVSILNLGHVARVAGWTWQPEVTSPVYFLLTLPLTCLPETWVPLALNLLSAVCASLVLLQLARCVALLPHDRTHDQREREMSDGAVFSGKLAWVPPVLAVFICGLQLTFWENATNGTSEMIDLLMFAFVVRALLEHRYNGSERWLSRAAFIFGAAMTGNAAMIAFFPLYLAALIWIRGISFFNSRFLSRVTLFWLAGLSLYLLLPLVASIKSPELISFWGALKFNVATQKQLLGFLPHRTLVLLSLVCLVPIFVISIRWASYFGDSSLIGQILATAVFHVAHAFFLGLAIWVALDPPFAPRSAAYGVLPFLPYYFLGALGAGYFSGYFLLVFGPRAEKRMRRAPTPVIDLLNKCSIAAVLFVLVATPIALVMRNYAEIRTTNGPMLRHYAASLAETLPDKGILVNDELSRQFILQAWLASESRTKDYLLVNSEWLKWDSYHRYLHQRHGAAWPAPDKVEGKPRVSPSMLISLLSQAARSNHVFYLHPSFGYYFEAFRAEPRGLAFELKPYGATELLPPALTPDVLTQNEAFFSKLVETSFQPILAVTDVGAGVNQYVGTGPLRKIRLRRHKNGTAMILGTHFSRTLNYWGVAMQKAGQLEPAARWFDLAVRLNPDNVVAARNLEFNRKFRAGEKPVVEIPKSVEDLFGQGRSWDQVLTANGPYDDPSLCQLQGFLFVQTGLYRQAAQCFDRVRNFSDTDLASRIWLAQLHLMASQPDAALALAREIHEHADRFPLDQTNRMDLLSIEAAALYGRKDAAGAAKLIESAIAADPRDDRMLTAAIALYNQHGQFTNSLVLIEGQLAQAPDNLTALLNKGYVCIQLGAYDEGIAALTHLLRIETNNASAQLNRAIAYLRSGKLTEAKADYETLQRQYPTTHQLYYGLAEIALRQGDTNAAIRHSESYLTNAPANTAEYQAIGERLRALKGDKPK